MRHIIVAALAAALLTVPPSAAETAELEGITFSDTIDVDGIELELNGLGLLRYMYFIKVYVAALYLPAGVPPGRALEDVPKRLEFEYRRSLRDQDFRRGTTEAIAYQKGDDGVARFREEIDEINSLYKSVEEGDRYAINYVPGEGMTLELNGEPQGTVKGADFARAFFAIWLADTKPLNEDLRDALLDRS